jgi:hypothetical protein
MLKEWMILKVEIHLQYNKNKISKETEKRYETIKMSKL